MVNLFEEYPAQAPKSSVNLFDEYNDANRPGTEEEALELAKKQISAQYPGMPDWLRDAILKITPKTPSPMLDSAARGVSAVTDYIPAVAGGLLQGASLPIRGVASTIPAEFTQRLAGSPNLANLFQRPSTEGQQSAQDAAQFFGALGPYGKMFSGLKGLSQAARVPKALQNTAALAGTGYLGTPGDSTDKVLGTAGALALGGAGKVVSKGAEKMGPFMRGLFNDSTPEALIESVQNPHDILDRTANQFYNQVKQGIKKRDIKIPMKKELLEQAKEYFPQRTTATKELFERAEKGDYDAIHDIQSSLYTKGTKQLSGDDLVKENEGEEIIDLRNKMNEFLENHLIKEGHLDIAHVLRQGKDAYKELMDTYFHKNLPKGIGKLVHRDLRLVPDNPVSLFKQNSVPMKRFLQRHPETEKHAQGVKEKEAAMKALKKIMYASGGTGAAIAGGKALYDLFD